MNALHTPPLEIAQYVQALSPAHVEVLHEKYSGSTMECWDQFAETLGQEHAYEEQISELGDPCRALAMVLNELPEETRFDLSRTYPFEILMISSNSWLRATGGDLNQNDLFMRTLNAPEVLDALLWRFENTPSVCVEVFGIPNLIN